MMATIPFSVTGPVRVSLVLVLGASLHLAGGCEKKADDTICGLQPPYDSAHYEAWQNNLAEAGCFDKTLDESQLKGRQTNLVQ